MSKKSTESTAPTFTKAKLIESRTYRDKRDLLTALLSDDRVYTINEVDAEIEKFMKGKVK